VGRGNGKAAGHGGAGQEECPWCCEKAPEDFLRALKEEVAELEEAFRKGDYANAREELGDVLWDAVMLAQVCERKGLFGAESVVDGLMGKIRRRKPWLVEGRAVGKEEAERVWKEAKARERGNKV